MARNFYINEGNNIGGQEPQMLGSSQSRLKAGAGGVTKGQLVAVTAPWTILPTDGTTTCIGVAFDDYAAGANAVVITEGLFKLTASGVITGGSQVTSAAGGKVAAAAEGDQVVGIAFNTVADGEECYVKFTIGGTGVGAKGDTIVYAMVDIPDLAADGDIASKALFVVPTGKSAKVLSAHIISGGSAAGVDNANISTFVLKQGTDEICSKIFNTDTTFPEAGAMVAFGAINADHDDLAADAVLILSITSGTTADLPACQVQVLLQLFDA
jgi:hypothetical protein